MKRDRFERMVDRVRSESTRGSLAITQLTKRDAVRLLSRQHAAFVRLVKKCQSESQYPYNHHMQAGSQNAFEMILAELVLRNT